MNERYTGPRRRLAPEVAAAVFLLLSAAAACEREPEPVRPPEIAYGEQTCDRCGMIITEERYAAGLMLETDRGRAYRTFDDVAAVALFGREHPEARVLARWVKDYGTRRWLSADSARYVRAPGLETPMAFGVVAAAPDRADSLAAALGGRVLTWSDLTARADTGGIGRTPRRGGAGGR